MSNDFDERPAAPATPVTPLQAPPPRPPDPPAAAPFTAAPTPAPPQTPGAVAVADPDRDRIAAALPSYDVGEQIGRGGWGAVYEGRHRQLGREVAIKELPGGFSNDPEVQARFIAEARVLASLDHPHVVPIYDYVEKDGLCLLVMEKLSGGTVWNRFVSAGLSMEAACAAILATCAGLQSAHQHHILHRDIKPENLIFNADGTLKVTDFGIAKVLGGQRTVATRAGEVIGTPAYMAPEQARGEEVTPATDVYAVGVMLYELLSGRRPFIDDADPLALLFKHAYSEPPGLDEVAPNVPKALVDVTMKALAKDPADRYQTAEELGVAVAEAATDAWGSGWLMRASVPVMAAGAMVAATERLATDLRGPGTSARDVNVRPMEGTAPKVTLDHGQLKAADFVPVEEVVPRPPVALPAWLLTIALVVATFVVAFTVSIGDAERTGDIPTGTVTVGGADPSGGQLVTFDLSRKFVATGHLPALTADSMRLSFSAAGIPLGSGDTKVGLNPDGTFTAGVDGTVSRWLIAGPATATVTFRDATGATVAQREFEVESTQKPYLTAPFWAALLILLFALSYVESMVRALRRGRKRVMGIAGLTSLGVPIGLAASTLAWTAADTEPTTATLVLPCAIAAAGGLAAAWAAIRSGHRRRAKFEAAAAAVSAAMVRPAA